MVRTVLLLLVAGLPGFVGCPDSRSVGSGLGVAGDRTLGSLDGAERPEAHAARHSNSDSVGWPAIASRCIVS